MSDTLRLSPMPRLEVFTMRAALVMCAFSIISLALVPFIGARDMGTPSTVIGILFMVSLCVLHAIATEGVKKAVGFVVAAALITWFVEFIGCNYGWWFGEYEYTNALGPRIGNVPIMVVISWEAIIFPSMMLVDNFLARDKPLKNSEFYLYIIIASLATGLVVTAWDFITDPVSVHLGYWRWDDGGGYMPDIDGGIPFSNFGLKGWVGAVFLISALYRVLFTDAKSVHAPRRTTTILAAALYTSWLCNALYGCFMFGFHQVALIGVFVMGPVVLLSWGRLFLTRT
ncbi:carotenoid biosynthesis protein [Spongiibacter sp. KMU-158]|uniref:Carotenoid biosynthesis protein n=1 Tax=Spongiibacter pelagi TaxID=2760804 RepID=A0A927C1D6_9GAMM|nr:carotenoid biosynthesis protein [Spongiibacter pelagi]MBD2859468.1 carotenoid biosynthesis protein [Spongiibacter pelagi]